MIELKELINYFINFLINIKTIFITLFNIDISTIISKLKNPDISDIGAISTAITAIFILWQILVSNKQTKEQIKQNKFANDYSIYKESLDRIEKYFEKINLEYKQDNYITYFYYQFMNLSSNSFYLDNEKDFLQDDNDFKEAIIKTHTLLGYLDYIVGHVYYDLKRISEDNLELILSPVRNYILYENDTESERTKNYAVSFLYYTFWCYDDKEGKEEFSYPNLLKYLNNDNSKIELAKQCSESENLTKFINNSFSLLKSLNPNEFDKDTYGFLSDQKKILTDNLKKYLEKVSNINKTNPNVLYFICFEITWSTIFSNFIKELNEIKNHYSFKPIFDNQVSLTFENSDKEFKYIYKNLKLSDADKKELKSLQDYDRYSLVKYYEEYHNFDKALNLYRNFTKNRLNIDKLEPNYEIVLYYFCQKFSEEYKKIEILRVLQMFNPLYSSYFIRLLCENDLIIRILEECEIYHDKAKYAKLNEK